MNRWAQNRLVTFVARYVSVTSSEVSRFGFSAERTLILPGDVRYEVDLAKLQPEDVRWDAGSNALSVRIPEIEVAGPEVDLSAAREYGSRRARRSDNSGDRLGPGEPRRLSRICKQACRVPMRLARNAARQAIERSFAMPLQAAGFANAKVVARFAAEEGITDSSYLDRSLTYNQAIEEARRRRAGEGAR